MQSFYVAVWNFGALILMVKTSAEKIPMQGDEVEIDFKNPGTEFIEGEWGKEAAVGSFWFTVNCGLFYKMLTCSLF